MIDRGFKEGEVVRLSKNYEGLTAKQLGVIIKLMDNGVILQTSVMEGSTPNAFRGYRVFVVYSAIEKN